MLRKGILLGLIGLLLAGVGAFAQEPVTIEFWHSMSSGHQPHLVALVDKFMAEYPYITVNLTYQGGYGDTEDKVEASVVAGTPPTMVQLYENVITPLVEVLYPIGPHMTAEEQADILDGLVENNTFDGVLVSVPWNKSIMVLYYRPDLVPTPPTTWEEFLAVSAALTVDVDGDGVIDRYGTGLRPYNPELYLNYLVQNGGTILNDDWSAVTIGDQPGLEAMQYAESLVPYSYISSGYLSDVIGQDLLAMFVDTSAGYYYNVKAATDNGLPLTVAVVPAGPVNAKSAIQGTNLVVFDMGQTQAQKDAGVLLAKFLIRPENTVAWSLRGGYLPVVKSAYETQEWLDYLAANPDYVVMSEAMVDGFAQILHPNYGLMRGVIGSAFEEVILGASTAAEAMANLVLDLTDLLDE
ncbi:ABC transporter substrate-binding protein [Candidatus Bipolaricaulota bacterium]|jgi:ABC-type glycerol-3-phosphate transport system substrate-binding protein|nr:ABC transporter substrate-binding protein [Candidatus Bipolaricaulota bacterium]